MYLKNVRSILGMIHTEGKNVNLREFILPISCLENHLEVPITIPSGSKLLLCLLILSHEQGKTIKVLKS